MREINTFRILRDTLNKLIEENDYNFSNESLNSIDDTPDDLIHELFSSEFWQEHPLGLPVLGSRQSVTKAEYEQLKIFFRKY